MDKLNKENLFFFLKTVDRDFPVNLSDKVDLKQYTDKLLKKATICYKENNSIITGVVAGYTDNLENGIAYIALVGVIDSERKKGIANNLICDFITICKKKSIKGVHVYTDKTNSKAIAMYKGLGFDYMKIKDEPRPDDVHFYLEL